MTPQKHLLFCLIFSIGLLGKLPAQNPFVISVADIGIGAGAIAIGATGLGLDFRKDANVLASGFNVDASHLNRLDRPFSGRFDENASKISDALAIGLIASPLTLLALKLPNRDILKIGIMASEAGLLSYGLVGMSKGIFRRQRPFSYAANLPIGSSTFALDEDAKKSFFSGHTTMTTTALFFGASVFEAYRPNSKLRPFVYTFAATGGAAVAYLRMRAGKHFPTDVLLGYVVGANIGMIVPWLHRRYNVRNRNIWLSFSGNSFNFNWKF